MGAHTKLRGQLLHDNRPVTQQMMQRILAPETFELQHLPGIEHHNDNPAGMQDFLKLVVLQKAVIGIPAAEQEMGLINKNDVGFMSRPA